MTNMLLQAKHRLASSMWLFGSLNGAILTHVVFVCSDVVWGCATCGAARKVMRQVEGCTCLILEF